MCLAQFVRDLNAGLWTPDAACEAAPEMLVNEPITVDSHETPDGRSWVRVYMDSSAIDQNGHVHLHAPKAACVRRMELAA